MRRVAFQIKCHGTLAIMTKCPCYLGHGKGSINQRPSREQGQTAGNPRLRLDAFFFYFSTLVPLAMHSISGTATVEPIIIATRMVSPKKKTVAARKGSSVGPGNKIPKS
jgi:hypothetical protein